MDDQQLGPEIEDFLDEMVKGGRYGSRVDVLRDSLRLLKEREERLRRLDAHLAEGIADFEAGRTVSVDEAFDQLEAYVEELALKRNKGNRQQAA